MDWGIVGIVTFVSALHWGPGGLTLMTSAEVPLLNHSGSGHGVTSDEVQPILCGLNGRLAANSNGMATGNILLYEQRPTCY